MRSMLRCAASISSTSAGVINSSRCWPIAPPYSCLTRSYASCRIGAKSGIEYLLGVTCLSQVFHSRTEAANNADRFRSCLYAKGQAGRQRKRLAPPDGPAAEVAFDETSTGYHYRDREAPVAYLDLVGDFQGGGVEEPQHVVMEQAHLAGAMTGAQHARALPRPGEGRGGVSAAVIDHVQGQVPAQAHGRPGVVGTGRFGDDD